MLDLKRLGELYIAGTRAINRVLILVLAIYIAIIVIVQRLLSMTIVSVISLESLSKLQLCQLVKSSAFCFINLKACQSYKISPLGLYNLLLLYKALSCLCFMFLLAFAYYIIIYIQVPLVYIVFRDMSYSYAKAILYNILIIFCYVFIRLIIKALDYLIVTFKDLIIIQLAIKKQALINQHICLFQSYNTNI